MTPGGSSDCNQGGGQKSTWMVPQRIGEEKGIDVLNNVEDVTEVDEIAV